MPALAPLSARRALYDDVHEDFRQSFRTFLAREATPHAEQWERDEIVPRSFFARAGEGGFCGMAVPERFGGADADDFRFNAIIGEELAREGLASVGLGLTLHNDICLPYFLELTNEEQQERWLPGIVDGSKITALAMTEPGAGSDVAGIQTRAIRDGDAYVLDGSKTFITNGINADLVIVAARTDPDAGHRGLSLLVVEDGMPGFTRGRNLEKVGQHAQDTAELSFAEVRVPAANLLGAEGQGFGQLMRNLAQERLSIAISAQAASEAAFDWTMEYVMDRRAFKRPIGTLQNSRFVLAQIRTELEVTRCYVDRCVERLSEGALTAEEAAMCKLWTTELQGKVLDRCVQLHGGYGYMSEYKVARAWADARITRIYGGASEIMLEIIGRGLGLDDRA